MSDKRFSSIENYEVPQVWIDNALSIPTSDRKKAIVWFDFRKTLATAATFVLVCTLSLLVFFFTKDGSIVQVNPNVPTTVTETVEMTDNKNENKLPTDSAVNNGATQETEGSEQTAQTTPSTTAPTQTEVQKPSAPEPTSPVPQQPTSAPEKVEPTQKPIETQPPTQAPTAEPTEPPTDKPPVEPSDAPIEPTYPPTDEPVAPIDPVEPSELPTDAPTQPPTQYVPQKEDYYIHTRFSTDLLVGNGTIYCKVVDSGGNLVGDPDLYSNEHLVEINRIYESYTFVRYYPYVNDVITKADVYSFYFYNEDGVIVAKSFNHVLDIWENMY